MTAHQVIGIAVLAVSAVSVGFWLAKITGRYPASYLLTSTAALPFRSAILTCLLGISLICGGWIVVSLMLVVIAWEIVVRAAALLRRFRASHASS